MKITVFSYIFIITSRSRSYHNLRDDLLQKVNLSNNSTTTLIRKRTKVPRKHTNPLYIIIDIPKYIEIIMIPPTIINFMFIILYINLRLRKLFRENGFEQMLRDNTVCSFRWMKRIPENVFVGIRTSEGIIFITQISHLK